MPNYSRNLPDSTQKSCSIPLNPTRGLATGGCSILWGVQLHQCLWKKVFIFGPSSWPFETSMFLKVTKQTQHMFPGCTSGKERSPWNNPKRKLVFPAPFSEVLVAGSVTIQGHLFHPFAAEQALTAALYAIELTCIWCPVAEANNCRAQGHFLSWSDSESIWSTGIIVPDMSQHFTNQEKLLDNLSNSSIFTFSILFRSFWVAVIFIFPSWLGRFRNSSGA